MSSWDGENLYRGHNDYGFKVYPSIFLDRIFDSSYLVTPDGEKLILEPKLPVASDFKSEWEWNDYYKKASLEWSLNHPKQEADYLMKKFVNFFISVERNPCTYTNDASQCNNQNKFNRFVVAIWLGLGRLFQLYLIYLLMRIWQRNASGDRYVFFGILAALSAYALPCIIGFNYDRHVTVFLVLIEVTSLIIFSLLRVDRQEESVCATN